MRQLLLVVFAAARWLGWPYMRSLHWLMSRMRLRMLMSNVVMASSFLRGVCSRCPAAGTAPYPSDSRYLGPVHLIGQLKADPVPALHGFCILDDHDPVETLHREASTDDPDDVAMYERTVDALWSVVAVGQELRRIIGAVLADNATRDSE